MLPQSPSTCEVLRIRCEALRKSSQLGIPVVESRNPRNSKRTNDLLRVIVFELDAHEYDRSSSYGTSIIRIINSDAACAADLYTFQGRDVLCEKHVFEPSS